MATAGDLFIVLALQPVWAVNTQADSLVSDHLLPGVGTGAGGQWSLRVRAARLAARLEPLSPGRTGHVSLLGDRQAGEAGVCEGSDVPQWGPPEAGQGEGR